MNPVRPEELSALLDGELEPARAREVEAQIAIDPSLRREFESLSATDAVLRVAAGAAAFTPDVKMPAHAGDAHSGDVRWLPALVVAIGVLIAARILLKLAGSEVWAFTLPAMSLVLLLAGVVWLVRAEQDRAAHFPDSMQEAAS